MPKAKDEPQALICIDGVVSATFKKFTPDISWAHYTETLRQRRPRLPVLHLQQTADWSEILSGRATAYDELVVGMADEVLRLAADPEIPTRQWQRIAVLGFSLGGLMALDVVNAVSRNETDLRPSFLAYVTFGTPFGGMGYVRDEMLRRLRIGYVDRIFERETTKRRLKELLQFAREGQLQILLGAIEHDELVSQESALLPADWLYFAQSLPGLSWSSFYITPRRRLRAHDGLLHDPDALAYIDGLVDTLLPPA